MAIEWGYSSLFCTWGKGVGSLCWRDQGLGCIQKCPWWFAPSNLIGLKDRWTDMVEALFSIFGPSLALTYCSVSFRIQIYLGFHQWQREGKKLFGLECSHVGWEQEQMWGALARNGTRPSGPPELSAGLSPNCCFCFVIFSRDMYALPCISQYAVPYYAMCSLTDRDMVAFCESSFNERISSKETH